MVGCATFLLLVSGVAAKNLLEQDQTTESPGLNTDVKPQRPSNSGPPLNSTDFELGSKLPKIPPHMSVEQLLKAADYGEMIGAQGHPDNSTDKSGLGKIAYHWRNGVVPYVISAAFTDEERAVIASGIEHIEDNTCVRFVAWTAEVDYMNIIPGDGGCYAMIPYRVGGGERIVGLEQNPSNIAYGCVTMKVVVHELLHILGVKHEQSRPDRDGYVTIDWSNNAGPSQYERDAFVGTDPSTLAPECSSTLNNYDNCWSGWFVDAGGLPYDYYSVMHYTLSSFAIDSSKPVMAAIDTSVTSVGNTELSTLDIQKLQYMYQCDGTAYNNCGGHRYGTSGTMDGSGDGSCEWLLSAEGVGVEVVISFTSFAIPGDCSVDYLEIRAGTDSTALLIGKYCDDNPPPSVLSTKASDLWIKYSKVASTDNFQATWNAAALTCCNSVMVENFDGQTGYQGLFTKGAAAYNDHPVYESSAGDQLWYSDYGGWRIGSDYTSGSYGISADVPTYCPEDVGVGNWMYYNGDMVVDADANARCSDCTLFPAADECLNCCTSVSLTSTDSAYLAGAYADISGSYTQYTPTPEVNDRLVYKHDSANYCMYYNGGKWKINLCDSVDAPGYYMSSGASSKKCVHGSGLLGSWSWSSFVDATMDAICSIACTAAPPAAPAEANADLADGSLTAGTVVTYTCPDTSVTAQAVCDAATATWLPATIPSDLCSGGGAPQPPAATTAPPATQPPTAKPPKPKDCGGMVAYVKAKTLKKKKKVKTAIGCQTYCTKVNGANYFQWKSNKNVKKRLCSCQKVELAYKKAKKGKTTTGPLTC